MNKIVTTLLFISTLFCVQEVYSDTIPIDQSICTVIDYSSSGSNNTPDLLFDGANTAWSTYDVNNLNKLLPAYIVVDLGEEKSINGINCQTHANTYTAHVRKPAYTKVYVSNDTAEWGEPQLNSMFQWSHLELDDKIVERRELFFGAKTGRYVKVVFKDTYSMNFTFKTQFSSADKRIWMRDMFFYEDTDGASLKLNPIIQVEKVGVIESVLDPFEIVSSVNSDQTIVTSVVYGPATIEPGTNTLTLTGDGGFILVKCEVEENDTHNSAANYIAIPVLDIKSFEPAIKASINRSFPMQMRELSAYPISFWVDSLPDYVSVDLATIKVNGADLEVTEIGGGYTALWTPEDYGYYIVEIEAVASNGNVDTEVYNIQVTKDATDINVQALDKVLVSFGSTGQSVNAKASLPHHVGAYNKITGNFSVSCPSNLGCDPYDRATRIWAKTVNSDWIEIIRYVTPFGVGCNHTIDLTDYASLLQGEVEFRIYIETWTNGWDVSLDLDYEAGTPEYDYTKITQVWNAKYQFGNYANLQPVPEAIVAIDTNVAEAKLNLVTTGHGWGDLNTGNAAEFYHAQHKIIVNEDSQFDQDLWVDCNPNPDGCTGQMGTWQHDRAGWCPGSIAALYSYDLNDEFNATDDLVDSVSIQYIFQEDYIDLCHPNHPDCETGVTCNDCNDSYNPSYFVSGNVISYLKNTYVDTTGIFDAKFPIEDLSFSVYPTAGNGEINLAFEFDFEEATVELIGLNGNTINMYLYYDANELKNRTFDFTHLNDGLYFIRINTEKGVGVSRFTIN